MAGGEARCGRREEEGKGREAVRKSGWEERRKERRDGKERVTRRREEGRNEGVTGSRNATEKWKERRTEN